MKTLIKEIRTYVKLSQKEFADMMGTVFATVNRWENGKAVPNKMAQMKLFDFCVEHNVPLFDFVMNKINEESNAVTVSEESVLLYHASKSGITGNIAPISRGRCDFGQGFYMGTDSMQLLTLICDFEDSHFYIVTLKTENVKMLDVPANIEWAMLVAYHRGKMERIKQTAMYARYQKMFLNYDVIIGSIANDRMFYVLDNFFLGNITDTALIMSLSALKPGQQYVCVTQRACDAVTVEKEISLSYLERKCLQNVSEKNRSKGISAANEICKVYRRDGKYFDEILDDAEKGAL